MCYFENERRSGGGEVQEVERTGSTASVTFVCPDGKKLRRNVRIFDVLEKTCKSRLLLIVSPSKGQITLTGYFCTNGSAVRINFDLPVPNFP